MYNLIHKAYIMTKSDTIVIYRPLYQKVIRGEGMPAYGENCDKRGDIVLKFKIEIPRDLSVIKKIICKTTSETEDFKSLRK